MRVSILIQKSLFLLTIAFLSAPAYCQLFSAGVKAGVPLNDAITGAANATIPTSTDRYLIGPTIEVHLPFGLGVEADGLYRHYTLGSGVNDWEFPILAKYRFSKSAIHPFVDAGPTFNHVSDISLLPTTKNTSVAGVSLGAGLDFKFLLLHISPEVRYVHWGSNNYTISGLKTGQNEGQFLVGFTF